MTLSEEGNRLRLEIVRLGEPSKRKFPDELRKRILDWVSRSKVEGMNESECGDVLDIPRQRFTVWRGPTRRAARPKPADVTALVPVEIREEPKPFGPLSFVAPSGHRVEGLTIGEAIALLRAFA